MFLEIIAVVTVVAAALLAFGFGGRDEQLAAIGFLAATLATRSFTSANSAKPQAQPSGTRLINSTFAAACRHLFAPPP